MQWSARKDTVRASSRIGVASCWFFGSQWPRVAYARGVSDQSGDDPRVGGDMTGGCGGRVQSRHRLAKWSSCPPPLTTREPTAGAAGLCAGCPALEHSNRHRCDEHVARPARFDDVMTLDERKVVATAPARQPSRRGPERELAAGAPHNRTFGVAGDQSRMPRRQIRRTW